MGTEFEEIKKFFDTKEVDRKENLLEEDKQKYNFLIAKACILLKVEIQEAIESLEKWNIEPVRDPESMNLLSLCYMRS